MSFITLPRKRRRDRSAPLSSSRGQGRRALTPVIEPLEGRTLLAGGRFHGGLLVHPPLTIPVQATPIPSPDLAQARPSPSDVRVRGKAPSVGRITLAGLGVPDVDGDGLVTRRDFRLARRQLQARLRHHPLTVALARSSSPVGQGIVTGPIVVLGGVTYPRAWVRLFRAGSPKPEQHVRADLLGRFHFLAAVEIGVNRFSVSSLSPAGRRFVAAVSVSRVSPAPRSHVDHTPPVVAIDGRAGGLLVNRNVTITGRASDNASGVASLRARVDGGPFVRLALHAGGGFRFTTGLHLDGSADGSHSVAFKAVDRAGNASGLARDEFTLDTRGPAKPLFHLDPTTDSAPTGDGQTAFSSVTLAGRTDPGTAVVVDGTGIGATSDDAGTFTLAGVSLVPGANALVVRATDAAGNVSVARSTITRVAPPPLAALPGRDQGALVGDTVILDGVAEGAVGPATFQWALLNQPAGSTLTLADPAAPAQALHTLVPGEYRLSLAVGDESRRSDPAAVTLTVTDQPPPPPASLGVLNVAYTDQRDGLVDPSSAVVVTIGGPVDPASLTASTVILSRDGSPLTTRLDFDPATSVLTVTPAQPLPLDGAFTLSVAGLTSTAEPFQNTPFTTTFLTPDHEPSVVSGVVLTPDRDPLSGVTITIGGLETTTDAQGEFTLANVPSGPQLLVADPSTVPGPVIYTPLHFEMDIKAGPEDNTIGQPIVLTVVDTRSTISYPAQTVLTSPAMPGLEIDFTGAAITRADGTPYQGPLTLSPVRPADVPMPFPGATTMFWTVQPGGLLVSPRAKITVPLPIPMDPGMQVQLWAFDHGANMWANYGMGQVNPDGRTATSLPGQGQPFTGWGGVVTKEEVTRTIVGKVVDADGNPLDGVLVQDDGGQTAFTDYHARVFSGQVQGAFQIENVVVGYNVFVGGTFDRFEPADLGNFFPDVLTFNAQDIDRNVFSVTVFPELTQLADPLQLDGNLPSSMDLGTVTLATDHVIDAGGKIHLHRDLVTDKNSDTIRPDSPVASSARYQAEVRAVTRKLASMGFREDPQGKFLEEGPSYTAGSAAQQDVQLFQVIWFYHGLSAGFTAADVDGQVGPRTLAALNDDHFNNLHGVVWTTNLPLLNGFFYKDPTSTDRYMNATIPGKLADVITKSIITAASEPLGGIHGHQTHAAGSEVDIRWITPDGTPFIGEDGGGAVFYQPLKKANGTFTSVPGDDTPDSKQEWTDQDRAQGINTEAKAIDAGRTWRTRDDYSRAKTEALIDQLLALHPTHPLTSDPQAEVIFDDPGIHNPLVGHHADHASHIHVGYLFNPIDILPPGTDGAPVFSTQPPLGPAPPLAPASASQPPPPAASPAATGPSFHIVALGPGDDQEVVSPATTVHVQFSNPVNLATLTTASVRLLQYATGEDVPYTLRIDGSGTHVELIPNAELPEHQDFAVILGDAIRDTSGRTLVLHSGPFVTSFSTGLSPSIISASFGVPALRLSRDDLSGAQVGVLGRTADGTVRDVSRFVEQLDLVQGPNHLSLLSLTADGRVSRLDSVINGRGILYAALETGVVAAMPVEIDLAPSARREGETLNAAGPVVVAFGEPVNTSGLQVLSASVVADDGSVHPGTIGLSSDGQTLSFTPDQPLPTATALTLEIVLKVTDSKGISLEIVQDLALPQPGAPAAPGPLFGVPVFPTGISPFSLASSDLNGDGMTDLVTVDSGFGTVAVLLGQAGGKFALPVEFNLPENDVTLAVALGDLNGDGKPDLVVSGANVWVYLGQGDGTFNSPMKTADIIGRRALALGDLNGDGKLDLTALNPFLGEVEVFAGGGDGSFASPVSYATDSDPEAVALGDVNGDGKPDILSANPGGFSGVASIVNTVSVLLNQGDGSFGPRRSITVGRQPTDLALGDLNDDGHLDFVTPISDNSGTVSVRLGRGDGTFTAGPTARVGRYPLAVVLADLNKDGHLDLITANAVTNDLSVLLGNGDGTFGAPAFYPVGADLRSRSLIVTDVNGDGFADVVSPSVGGSAVWVLTGRGDGTLVGQEPDFAVGLAPRSVALGDLDGDGTLDAVTANSKAATVSVLLGNGNGAFDSKIDYPAGTGVGKFANIDLGPDAVALGDLNGDGKLDIVAVVEQDDAVSILLGNGGGTFARQTAIPVGRLPVAMVLADLNGDGALDLVTVGTDNSGTESVLLGRGDGTFGPRADYKDFEGDPMAVAVGDFNGDKKLDLIVAYQTVNNGTVGDFAVRLGAGDGTFGPLTEIRHPGGAPLSVAVGDLDGDGYADIVTADHGGILTILLNKDGMLGSGDVATNLTVDRMIGPRTVALADLDGDGKLDIIATNESGNSISVYRNHGDGTFKDLDLTEYGVGIGPSALALGDLDGNGLIDVVTANQGGATISPRLNKRR